jgi:glutathione synthase/RimK-type ligase-like ATP-grasp enzyme
VGLYGANNYYISEYIPKVAEYRVFLCQGRVVWVAKKTPANAEAVAWNVAKGGRFDNVNWGDWPLKAVRIAREAFMMSKLDFGGVDIMVDKDNNCYVLEINSAPSQTSPYRQECTAKAFDYIVRNGKAVIPVTEARGDWKKFIHPAISEAAIMV